MDAEKSAEKSDPTADTVSLKTGELAPVLSHENKNLKYIRTFDPNSCPEEVSLKQITKKLDKILIFPMLFVYFLQFLDKVTLNYSNVMKMPEDLHLKGDQFSYLATFFFVAYLVAEFFQAFLLQKFPVHLVLGINVIVWGICTMCCAAPNNFGGILAVRIILGIAESAVLPCLLLLTMNFYTKAQAAFRIGIFYSGLGFGQLFGGLLSFLFQLITSNVFQGWRILYLVVGFFNLVCGVYVLIFIPSEPLSTSNLTPKEKYVLLLELTDNKSAVQSYKFKPRQVLEILVDPQSWLYLVISVTITWSSNTISSFSAQDIMGFGFTAKEAALLNMPSGAVSIISSWISTFFIMRGTKRYIAICLLLVPAICGAALMSYLPKDNKGGLLAGIYLVNCITAPLAVVYSWASANVAGSTKKIGVVSVFINCGFGLGNVLSPLTYRSKDKPYYEPAKISMLAMQAASFGLALITAGIYYSRNKKRQHSQVLGIDRDRHGEAAQVWNDLTDMENKNFIYSY